MHTGADSTQEFIIHSVRANLFHISPTRRCHCLGLSAADVFREVSSRTVLASDWSLIDWICPDLIELPGQ